MWLLRIKSLADLSVRKLSKHIWNLHRLHTSIAKHSSLIFQQVKPSLYSIWLSCNTARPANDFDWMLKPFLSQRKAADLVNWLFANCLYLGLSLQVFQSLPFITASEKVKSIPSRGAVLLIKTKILSFHPSHWLQNSIQGSPSRICLCL